MCYDPIDRDESSLDIFLGLAAGADSGMCEIFLEFHRSNGVKKWSLLKFWNGMQI
jgi:hypothetical protein